MSETKKLHKIILTKKLPPIHTTPYEMCAKFEESLGHNYHSSLHTIVIVVL